MSVSELLDNNKHLWANLRMNKLTVDNDLIVNGPNNELYINLLNKEELLIPVVYGGTLWNNPQNKNIWILKEGRVVTMWMQEAKDNSIGGVDLTIELDYKLDERFRPLITSGIGSTNYSNKISGYTANGYEFAYLIIENDGTIIITFKNPPSGVSCGIDNCSFTWLTSE